MNTILGILKDSTLLGAYQGPPPAIPTAKMYVLSAHQCFLPPPAPLIFKDPLTSLCTLTTEGPPSEEYSPS